jgi:hypothetical protein
MKNLQTDISYMVSTVEMVEQLMWNNRNIKHIAEYHITKHEKVHGILRETCFFQRANAELGGKKREVDVLAARQRSPSSSLRRNYRTCVAQTEVRRTSHRRVFCPYYLHGVHQLVRWHQTKCLCCLEGCNHSYQFSLTVCSRLRLILLRMVLPTKGICTPGHRKVNITWHSVIWNSDFQFACCLECQTITL